MEDVLIERRWAVGPFDRARLNGQADLVEHKGNVRIPLIVSHALHEIEGEIMGLCDVHIDADGTRQFHRQMILEEALVNAALHGNDAQVEGTIEVLFRIKCIIDDTGKALYHFDLQISDDDVPDAQGRRFAFANVPDCTAEENLEKGNGRGLLLMRDLCKAQIASVQQGTRKQMTFLRIEDLGEDGVCESPTLPFGLRGAHFATKI